MTEKFTVGATGNLKLFKCGVSTEPMSASKVGNFKAIAVTVPHPFVYHVELNRPDRYNALNNTMWL